MEIKHFFTLAYILPAQTHVYRRRKIRANNLKLRFFSQAYEYKQRMRHQRYNTFAAMHLDAGEFPGLGVVGKGTLLSGPSRQNIENFCKYAFEKVSWTGKCCFILYRRF